MFNLILLQVDGLDYTYLRTVAVNVLVFNLLTLERPLMLLLCADIWTGSIMCRDITLSS